jgi:WD40 repeat protein
MTTGKQLRQLTCLSTESAYGYSPDFGALIFTPDGKRLLTCGPDHFLRVWDPHTSEELRKVPFDPRGTRVLALSKDGKTLAAGAGMAIHLLDLPSGKAYEAPEGEAMAASHPYFALLTPDGRTAVTGSWDHAAVIWGVDAGRVRQRLEKHNTFVNFLQLSRDGKILFSHDNDKVLKGWDLSRREERFQIQLNFAIGWSRDMIVSPDNRSLFLTDDHGMIHQLDAATGKERHHFQGPKFLLGTAYSPDGPSLVGWSGDRKIRVWDAANGRLQHEYSVPGNIKGKHGFGLNGEHSSIYSAALSPDGRLLAMGSELGHNLPKQKEQFALMFKDLKTGRDIAPCDPLPSAPERLLFSPDGRMLAWSGSFIDPTIHLLEVASGRERRRLAGHRGRITALAFSADGRRLLSGSSDTTEVVWDLGETRTRGSMNAPKLEALWNDLAGEDAARAYQAIHQLAAAPDVAIPFLRKYLRPLDAVDAKHLNRLIGDLGSDEFVTRQKATEELAKFDEQAIPAYRKAFEGKPALESRRRLEQLLAKAQSAWWDSSGERLRSLRALEVLELAGTNPAREVLATLAAGADGARLTQEAKAARERLGNRPH